MAKKKGRNGGRKAGGSGKSSGYDDLTQSYRDVDDFDLMMNLDMNDIDQMFEVQMRKENS